MTGGASGIGAAVSRLLIAEGAAGVIIADIQPALGTALAASLGPAAHYLRTDVTREPDVAAAVDAALELSPAHRRLDVFVSNAGILGGAGAIDLLDLREYDHTLAVNLRGMVAGIKHAARAMKPARRGAIVCTGSTAGAVGGLGPHAYAVAKAGVRGLVRSAAFELRAHGVRVNMVSPDAVATPLVAHAFGVFGAGDGSDAQAQQHEQEVRDVVAARSFVAGAVLTPEAVAEAVAWLASDHAGYVTGHDLAVDGGRTVVAVAAPGDAWFTGRLPFLREGGARGVPPPPSSQDD